MQMKKGKLLFKVFFTMLKIGAFTFGGGYAMISLLQNEFVENKKWIDKTEFLDIIAIAESTPGPIAVNSATYIGYRLAGFHGSLIATVGMCIPSFTIIYIISLFFDEFLKITFIANAFKGIEACVVYLILSAGLKMFKGIKKGKFNITVFSLTIATMVILNLFSIKFSAIFYILLSGTAGFMLYLFGKIKHNKKMQEEKK